MHNVEFEFYPDDVVWILNREQLTINRGRCVQVDIRVYRDDENYFNHIIYWVILDGERGSKKVEENDIFATSAEALAALEFLLNPTPTPTNTPSFTVTPTPTNTSTVTPTPSSSSSVTPTPTVTMTPTASTGSSPTPSPTNTLTPTATSTVTPSVTGSASITPTPTNTSSITPTSAATMTPTPSASAASLLQYSSTIMGDNPILYYNMNESSGTALVDLVSGNNATFNSSFLLRTNEGIAGKGLTVNFNEEISAAEITTPVTLGKGCTIEFWINPSIDNINDGPHSLISDGTQNGIMIYQNEDYEVVFHGSESSSYETNPKIPVEVWTHVCVVIKNTNLVEYYFNGELDTIGYAETNNIDYRYINGNPGQYYGQRIDEFALYDYELTQQQIKNHYLIGLPEIGPVAPITPTPTNTITPTPTLMTPTPTPSSLVNDSLVIFTSSYNTYIPDDNSLVALSYVSGDSDFTITDPLPFVYDQNNLMSSESYTIVTDVYSPMMVFYTPQKLQVSTYSDSGDVINSFDSNISYIPIDHNRIIKVNIFEGEIYSLETVQDSYAYIRKINYNSSLLELSVPLVIENYMIGHHSASDFVKYDNIFVLVRYNSIAGMHEYVTYDIVGDALVENQTYSAPSFSFTKAIKLPNNKLLVSGNNGTVIKILTIGIDGSITQDAEYDSLYDETESGTIFAHNNISLLTVVGPSTTKIKTYAINDLTTSLDELTYNDQIYTISQFGNYFIFTTGGQTKLGTFDKSNGSLTEVLNLPYDFYNVGRIFGMMTRFYR